MQTAMTGRTMVNSGAGSGQCRGIRDYEAHVEDMRRDVFAHLTILSHSEGAVFIGAGQETHVIPSSPGLLLFAHGHMCLKTDLLFPVQPTTERDLV